MNYYRWWLVIIAAIFFGYYYFHSSYTVSLTPGTTQVTPLSPFLFEQSSQDWKGRPAMMVSREHDIVRTGDFALRIQGQSPQGQYSCAESPRMSAAPNRHYTFSGSMRIDSIETVEGSKELYFKIGLYVGGKWRQNIFSASYNFSHLGEWENFSLDFDTPSDGPVDVMIDVDKKNSSNDIRGTIYIDDVVVRAS